MARAIRIPIDDDEVFERMKARKQALDLTWEEVLHRGLRETPDEQGGEPQASGAGGAGQSGQGTGPQPGQRNQHGYHAHHGPQGQPGHHGQHGDRGRPGTERGQVDVDFGSGDSIGDVVDEIKGQVQNQVRESLRASMESVEVAGSDLEREMTELESAEDAVLRFPDAAGEDPRYQVPLRVRLETSRGGMAVDVVAVREGKSVSEMNRFDRETRRAINEHLARGETATLSFDGAERYEVGPVLSWGRDDAGEPTVTEVRIPEVVFDDPS